MDKSDSSTHGVLLATLRPKTYEQHVLSLDLMPCDERGGEAITNRRIRVEIVPSNTKDATAALNTDNPNDDWMACEVHIMAKVEPLPYSEDTADEMEDDGDFGEEDEHDDVVIVGDDDVGCDDGMCPE